MAIVDPRAFQDAAYANLVHAMDPVELDKLFVQACKCSHSFIDAHYGWGLRLGTMPTRKRRPLMRGLGNC